MNILLLHSSRGLRPAVHAAADRLRAAGHVVHVPDLYDGRTTDDVDESLAIRDEIGMDELHRRAIAAAAPLSDSGLVYAGFSLGGFLAGNLALADVKARGLLLLHATSDVDEDAKVDDLPVQVHVADPDAFEPGDWLDTWYLRMQRAGADVEIFRYRGAGHLFTDPDTEDYDEEAAEATWKQALGFLDSLD
ncbi:dienelactone hydrolase family protein [Streptomyces sp. NBC_01304]|uniref:dienelactone hydrolase family protein n=1 Tax=Streptomyces sp. NBC_01304 TaxID=2903818 RepID=UPI002E13E850|nr:dienelactone hydrolase family protein [Streptomyces sp. NBC_01304]